MKLIPGGATDQGQVRETNEDGYVVDRRLQLFAIADGMGGHRAGEVASATALEALRAAVASGTGLGDAITSANEAVHSKATGDADLTGMGTTLTAIVPDGNGVLVGHVGDSRAYLLRDGELRQLTTDHSLIEELVREGRLTEEQAAVHPQRSVITRALGVEDDVEVDVYPVPLLPGDRLLLCSDGLTTMLRPQAISALLRRESDPTRAANLLVDAANAAGGEDNITTIVIDIEDDGADPFAPAPASVGDAVTTVAPANGVDAAVATAAASDPDATAAIPAITVEPGAPGAPPGSGVPGRPTPATGPADPLPDGATAAQALARQDRATRRREHHPVRSAGRFARFVVPIVLILGLAIAVTAWYARRTYYVAFDQRGRVTVYQGRPGGLLFWDPTVVQHTKVTKDALTEDARLGVQDRKEFDTKDSAIAYVGRIEARATTTTSSTTTTTTSSPVVPVPST
ncbi:MAG TPA: Stp1/IreP family PP2C-type Ser/Thr phosphatase [Acidimicrobiia bacterium]